MARKTPFRQRSTVKSQLLSVRSTMYPGRAPPATLKAVCTAPNRSTVRAISCSMSASLVTSVWTPRNRSPNSLPRSSRPAALTSPAATLAPSAINWRVMARPMPDAPPVTVATLPAKRPVAINMLILPLPVCEHSDLATEESTVDVKLPEVKAEVEAAFVRYETALIANDAEARRSMFWNSSHTIRYGIGEILHGWEEIGAFRSARSPVGLARVISRTVITTFGRDFATASTLFHRDT